MTRLTHARTTGFLSLTLHAHLPYVINHGTWPHGMEWLLEVAAETYLPLLRVLRRLQSDNISLACNLNLSPILLEQLAHPAFKAEFPRYLERKIASAAEDESYFRTMQEEHYASLARYWQSFFSEALADFKALDGDLIAGFRAFHQEGALEILTCGATHGYMPLLGTDESLRAQIRVAVQAHKRHLGTTPRGIWVPECGYRPAGLWNFPVAGPDGSLLGPGTNRIGVEQAVSESGLDYFFVDTHLVERSAAIHSPYDHGAAEDELHLPRTADARRLYQPYFVEGPYANPEARKYAATVFPRDPYTGTQVWSGDTGYPGDENYLDFHKKRWPGGHRYWRVTGSHTDLGAKEPYFPDRAAERVQAHASHFVHLVRSALERSLHDDVPPILSAPFDAELFGHWWFEGPQWLEAVARILHAQQTHDDQPGIELITSARYLEQYPRAGFLAMHEGSWGANGNNEVWLNQETTWTWQQIYPMELAVRSFASDPEWKQNPWRKRVLQQLCRELLLMESSDWQFLITTGAARDYAETRFRTHTAYANELTQILESHTQTPEQEQKLAEIEERDRIFVDLDPSFWERGAHAVRSGPYTVTEDLPEIPAADPGLTSELTPSS